MLIFERTLSSVVCAPSLGLSVINSRGVALGKSFIWVGTLQTHMFKEYYCVLLIMDKLFNSRHITTTERILLGNKT